VVVRQSPNLLDQPTVLVLLDRTETPTDIEERDLATQAEGGPVISERVDPDVLGVDLPRFVVSGRLHEAPAASAHDGGLVHEPAPGEAAPVGYVDTHAEQPHHHPQPDSSPDPDVAPPFNG
jgi:hypothetical protein